MSSLVNLRKEKGYYLAYFVELRRMLVLNRSGALIVDYFFNKNYSLTKIATFFRKDNKSIISLRTIKNFLQEIKKDLKNPFVMGYPFFYKDKPIRPVSIELQINTTCNLRCKHCFQDEYGKLMPFEKAKKILEILHKAKAFEINLVGGEPFLHPQFFKILSLCEKYNFAVNIVTNGTFLNDNNIKKLSKFKNLAILISLEGIGEVNDKIRGKGVFQKVNHAINKLKEKGIHIEISTTLNAENVKFYKKMVEYSQDLDVPCNFNLFKPFKDSHSTLIIKPKDYFDVAINLARGKNRKAVLTNAAITGELVQHKQRDECRATLLGLSIDVDGKMVPCSTLREAGYYNRVKLPDFNENFIKTWRVNSYFREFRKRGFKECQARAYIFSQNINGNDPYGVNAFRRYYGLKH